MNRGPPNAHPVLSWLPFDIESIIRFNCGPPSHFDNGGNYGDATWRRTSSVPPSAGG
jgi:hypothetical protein